MKILLLKFIAATCLLLAGMIGLGMTLCGALSTFAALAAPAAEGLLIALIAVPLAWAGIVLMRFVYKVNWGLEHLFVAKDKLGAGTSLLLLGILGMGMALYGIVDAIGFSLISYRKGYTLWIMDILLLASGAALMRFVYTRVKHTYTWPYKLPQKWPFGKSQSDDKAL